MKYTPKERRLELLVSEWDRVEPRVRGSVFGQIRSLLLSQERQLQLDSDPDSAGMKIAIELIALTLEGNLRAGS